MKTMKTIIAVLTAAFAVTANAVEKPKLNVVPLNADKAVVSLVAEGAKTFELSVKNQTGDVVYYKQTEKPATGYQKIFDFSELEEGDYQLNMKFNGTNVSRPFTVGRTGINVGDLKMTYDPYFNFSNDLLKISYLNFEQDKLVLSIYSSGYDLLFEKELGNDFAVSTGYNLKNLKKGDYIVVLSSESDNYTFSLVK